MGTDGTYGARLLRQAGGTVIAEDESTCVVYGMPRSVVETGNADMIVPLPQVSESIASWVRDRTRNDG
jgi:two-component system chemotaxis response regulator CheB